MKIDIVPPSKSLIRFFYKKENKKGLFSGSSSGSTLEKTQVLFTQLYEDIKKSYFFIQKKDLYNVEIKRIHSIGQIPKPSNFNTKGFPSIVRKHIEETAVLEILYTFSLLGRDYKVYFVLEEMDALKSIEYFNESVERMMVWFLLIDKYASKKCSKTLTVYVYFTSLLKELPKNSIDIISENHANTAFTYTCIPHSEIVIFRKEEWFKVFLHESFHNFGLDFSGMNTNHCNEHILSIFKVNSSVNLYEAYTEFWAEIMNALITSFLLLKDKNDRSLFLENSFTFIDLERKFSFFQLVKVLNFMGLKYTDLFSNSKEAQIKRTAFYKENTSVLSYYVIKPILMCQFADFIVWCDQHHFSLLDFKKTIGHQKEFCLYIEKHYKTKAMLENVEYFEKVFSAVKPKTTFLKNTMRMTLLEIK